MTARTGDSKANGEEFGQLFDMTPQEVQVLLLGGMAYSHKEIADRLGVDRDTARKYVENIIARRMPPTVPVQPPLRPGRAFLTRRW